MNVKNSLKKMAEDKDNSAVQKLTIFWVDPRILKVEPGFNIRFEGPELDAHIDEMKSAYRAGAIFPAVDIRVDGDDTILVDGHCRRRMYLELIEEGEDIKKVEARAYTGNDADRVAHMLGSAQGKPLSTLEQGLCYLRLERFGWTRSQIIARSGKSATHVDQALMLANSNSDVQNMVASGEVSARNAVALLREHGERTGEVLAPMVEKAKREGKSKVTTKTIGGRAIPRKLVDRFASTIGELVTSLSGECLAGLDDVAEDAVVSVSAKHLKALLEAHAEVQQLRDAEKSPAAAATKEDDEPEVVDHRQASFLDAV
jgi:hypothetical protein